MVKVTFKTVQGSNFQLDLDATTKVSDVKAAIESSQGAGFPAANQVIIFSGKVLKDDTTLADNKVSENGFMVVMITKAKQAAPAAAAPAPAPAAVPVAPEVPAAGASAPAAAEAPASAPPAATGVSPSSAHLASESPAAAAAPDVTTGATGTAADPYSASASSLSTGAALEGHINQMVEMGFEREQVQRAMRAAFNNPDRAVEYLMTGIPASAEHPPPVAASGAGGAGGGGGSQAAGSGAAAAAASAGGEGSGEQPAASQPAGSGGPNAQPLDMFPQGMPNFGGGGGGAAQRAGALAFLRDNQQFQGLRHVVQANPQILQPMLQELGKQNPQLLQLINANQEEFLSMINEPGGGDMDPEAMAALGGLGEDMDIGEGGGAQIAVTEEEAAAIDRLQGMGFERAACIEAFIACDRNEEAAANFLLENMNDD
jgi:UV excision repair protein RAD23